MPTISPNTPTVSVQVPVPTPVPAKPKRPRAPVSFGGGAPQQPQVPQAPQPQQPQQPVQPQPSSPTAVILPWSPPPKRMSRKNTRQSLPLAKVVEHGVSFETGKPVEFNFVRNTEKSPKPPPDDPYHQKLEPHGRYMLHVPNPKKLPPKWEKGRIRFENPLVIPLTGGGDRIYGPTGWKSVLSSHYRKRGLPLSRALAADGYDGIVTVRDGETSEILDLTMHRPKRMRRLPAKVAKYAADEGEEPLQLRPGERTSDGGKFEPDQEPVDLGEFIANQFKEEYGEPSYGIGPSTGFLLPDGSGVPMGPGERYEDHRAAVPTRTAMMKWGWPTEIVKASDEGTRTPALFELMRRARAVRVHAGQGQLILHFGHELTNAQRRAIAEHVRQYQPETVVLAHTDNGREEELSHPHGGEVARAIDRMSSPSEPPAQMKRLPAKRIRMGVHGTDLPALFKAARENPYEGSVHGMIADKLEELHPDSPLPDLIRRQFGLGQYGGQGEKNNLWHDSFYNSYDGTHPYAARLGTHGPFDLYLLHEGYSNEPTARQPFPSNQGHNSRWVLRANSRLNGSRDVAYNFEFPHEEAHLIPRMFPAAQEYIPDSTDYTDKKYWPSVGRDARNEEANHFDTRMDEEEAARG